MTRLVFAQQVGEKWVAGKSYEADSKPAYFSLGSALGSCNGPLRLRERLNCFLIEDLSFRSEARHATVPRKKFDAEFALKIGYGFADRRLGNIQVPRSLPIPFPLDNRGEITKVSQLHMIGTPYQWITP